MTEEGHSETPNEEEDESSSEPSTAQEDAKGTVPPETSQQPRDWTTLLPVGEVPADVAARAPPLVPREVWSNLPRAERATLLRHPVPYVLLTHTGTRSCETPAACAREVRNLQRHHIALGHQDILYNFLVGGDGKVYEGTGWNWKPPPIPLYHEEFGDCIKIAYIGYYGDNSKKVPPDEGNKWVFTFIETGMYLGKVGWDVTYIPEINNSDFCG